MPKTKGIFDLLAKLFWDIADSKNRTICAYCGSHKHIENEHVRPQSRGGVITIPSCRQCNRMKSAKTPLEWFRNLKYSDRPKDQYRWERIVDYHKWGRNELSELIREIRDNY